MNQSENELLQRGLDLESDGYYEEALNVWSSASTELETPSLAISREFLRVATSRRLYDYYHQANDLYFWGLSAQSVEDNIKALNEEIDFLKPIIDSSKFQHWKSLYIDRDPGIYNEILLLWRRLDPVPSTSYNTRLLEHWERVAHAREQFTINKNSVYGTDERGISWVKYGEPDRIFRDILKVSGGQIASVIRNLDPLLIESKREALTTSTLDLHEFPRYEIWIYEKPDSQMEFNLILIFGDKPGGGFSNLTTVDEFIPVKAFSPSSRFEGSLTGSGVFSARGGGSRLSPGMILQYLYYAQFSTYDFYFSNIFSEMNFNWEGDPRAGENQNFGKFSGSILRQRTEATTRQNLNRAPNEFSTYVKSFPQLPLRAYHYRMLDEEKQPLVYTILESQARRAFIEDFTYNNDTIFSDDTVSADEGIAWYDLTHGLQYVADDGRLLTQLNMPAELILDFQEDQPSSSIFRILYHESGSKVYLYSELHNRHPESKPRIESPFPVTLRGVGKIESDLPEPLNAGSEELVMADLVFGYQMRDELRGQNIFPFVVSNEREIPEGEELALHLELYNLQRDETGRSKFQSEFQVLSPRRMEWLRGPAEEISLTIDQEVLSNRFTESIAIRTRELDPGKYRLHVIINDLIGKTHVERELEFEIVTPN